MSVHCSYLGSPRRSITGMSDRELFTPSEEESDSRGSYETPIWYKDYVGLSKSSSAVKRRRYSPLVLQTTAAAVEKMTIRRYLNPKLTGGKTKLMVVNHKYLVAKC